MIGNTAEIGIFGGTGIYDSELLQDSKEITIETPYGKTSDTITIGCLLYTSPSPRDRQKSRMPSSA